MLVNFLIVGTQKGGTTALCKFLSKHPNISIPPKKEVHFFDNDGLFQSSTPDYDIYHRNFNQIDEGAIFGEGTPIYMYWKPATKRIYNYNPNMKLIFILRNPVERAYSSYQMIYNMKKETMSFSDAIRSEKERLKKFYPKQHQHYSYLDRGLYSKQIINMLNFFNRNKMLFVKSEDLKND